VRPTREKRRVRGQAACLLADLFLALRRFGYPTDAAHKSVARTKHFATLATGGRTPTVFALQYGATVALNHYVRP